MTQYQRACLMAKIAYNNKAAVILDAYDDRRRLAWSEYVKACEAGYSWIETHRIYDSIHIPAMRACNASLEPLRVEYNAAIRKAREEARAALIARSK